MKKFFEAIKDLLYDSLDYIIILSIVVIVIVIIGWRIDLLFANDTSSTVETNDQIVNEANDPDEDVNDGIEKDRAEESLIVTVDIPSGSSSHTIGTILEEEGLVSNKDDFVEKAQELSLDTKLKSGSYEISKNSSLEDIIHLIAK